MTTWTPIDDPDNPAPRDGTTIIIYDHEVLVAEWSLYLHDRTNTKIEGWDIMGCEHEVCNINPTHWMPLPSPPEPPEDG